MKTGVAPGLAGSGGACCVARRLLDNAAVLERLGSCPGTSRGTQPEGRSHVSGGLQKRGRTTRLPQPFSVRGTHSANSSEPLSQSAGRIAPRAFKGAEHATASCCPQAPAPFSTIRCDLSLRCARQCLVSTQACHAAPAVGGLAQQPKKDSHALSLQSSVLVTRPSQPSAEPLSLFVFAHHPAPERESDISPFIGVALGIAAPLIRTPTHTPPLFLISVPS